MFLSTWAAVGASVNAWRVALQVVDLRNQAVTPHEPQVPVIETREFMADSVLQGKPEVLFSIIQGDPPNWM
ncbi:hypothetical protein Rhe02_19370 [Rhizocola hellebori]|uniref:Uncharacterized protein n=1 Tax=Rhizocola hellebori TaxID=1392758 RepID=A0A8J3Q4V9_9ACTN|nr:hypothetical protein Rhe02_19370 [Rhizocola hellebori]